MIAERKRPCIIRVEHGVITVWRHTVSPLPIRSGGISPPLRVMTEKAWHNLYPILSHMSRARIAALRLAASERRLPAEALACPRSVSRGCAPEGAALKYHLEFLYVPRRYTTTLENSRLRQPDRLPGMQRLL